MRENQNRGKIRPDNCAVCEMNPRFYDLLADISFRLKARVLLIAKYFEPVERIALYASLGLQATDKAIAKNFSRVMEEAVEAARRKGRSARFAVRVCCEYRYTCALTGCRCVTAEGTSIVDAAHIEPWSTTGNDDPMNGLAPSKNAHWMFDAGLWSADEDLRVIVNAEAFTENGPDATRLSSFADRHLQFDPSAKDCCGDNLSPMTQLWKFGHDAARVLLHKAKEQDQIKDCSSQTQMCYSNSGVSD